MTAYAASERSVRREGTTVAVVALAVLALAALRATIGTSLADDSYYAVVPLRLAQGARLLVDELSVQSIGSVFAVPFVWAWTRVVGLTGIVPATQVFYVGVAAIAGFVSYRLLRPTLRPAVAGLAVAVPLLAPNLHIFAVTYNTMSSILFTLAVVLGSSAMRDRRPGLAAASGACLALGSMAYPPFGVAAVVLFATFAWQARARRLVLPMLAAALGVGGLAAAALLLPLSADDVRRAVAFASGSVVGVQSALGRTLGYLSGVLELVSPWLLPMWALAAVASFGRMPSRLRGGALALLPLAAALPGVALLIRGDSFDFGSSAPSWLLTVTAGALVPGLLWAVRERRRDLVRLVVLAAPYAIAASLLVARFSNTSRNRGGALVAAAPLTLAVVAIWGESLACLGGRRFLALGCAAALVSVLGLLFGSVFGDVPVWRPRVRIADGAYAGLCVGEARAGQIGALTTAGRRYVRPDSRVLFFGEREGYLLVGGRIATNAVWLHPAIANHGAVAYLEANGGMPDVVFADDSGVSKVGGYTYGAEIDPLLARLAEEYRRVDDVAGFSVFVREQATSRSGP